MFGRIRSTILAGALAAAPAAAHPTFSTSSIVNAASFLPPEVRGGVIARGSIFTIFGSALGPQQAAQATTFPLDRFLAGVSITVSRPGFPDISALPLYVSDAQINAILPSNAPLGAVAIVVRFNDGDGNPLSSPIQATVVETAFGVFTINSSGGGPAIATNFVSQAEQPLNGTTESARRGQFITLWGTGAGAIAGPDDQRPIDVGGVVDLRQASQVKVYVGGVEATNIFYVGRSAEFAGLDQVIFEIPAGAPLGCYVPLWVKVKGGLVSNLVTLSISAEAGACVDAVNPYLGPEIVGAARIGAALLLRNRFEVGAAASTIDTGTANFQRLVNRNWFYNPALSLPPAGACTISTERNGSGGLPNPRPTAPLEAGLQLIVRGPAGAKSLVRTSAGFYEALFASTLQGDPPYLEPGPYTVESAGGLDVGALAAASNVPQPPSWTLSGDPETIDRGVGATVEWAGGDPQTQFVRVMGISSSTANPNNNVTATFVCVAEVAAGSLTIPADVLFNAPESSGSGVSSTGFLFVGFSLRPEATRFTADGLDYGFSGAVVLRGKPVKYR